MALYYDPVSGSYKDDGTSSFGAAPQITSGAGGGSSNGFSFLLGPSGPGPTNLQAPPLQPGAPQGPALPGATPTTTPGPVGGATGSTGATGYDPNALRAALAASGLPANAASLAQFIQQHPEFATGVTIEGSKNNKLYGPGHVFLADVIQGTDSGSPSWAWDTSTGTGSTGTGTLGSFAIDPSYLAPFTTPPPTGDTLPSYTAPAPFSYPDFQAPTADSILQDPSYQFRLNQGAGALENSAAAKGVLNSGGTLKDLMGYGQQMASQEWGNIWSRDLNAWDANRNNAAQTFATNYGMGRDTYQTLMNQNDTQYQRALQGWQGAKDTYYANQTNPFNKLSNLASLGYQASTV